MSICRPELSRSSGFHERSEIRRYQSYIPANVANGIVDFRGIREKTRGRSAHFTREEADSCVAAASTYPVIKRWILRVELLRDGVLVGHGGVEDQQRIADYVEEVAVIRVVIEGFAPGDCEEGGLAVAED